MDLDTRPLHRLAFNFTQRPLEVLQQQKKKEIKTFVELLTGYLELHTRSITTLCIVNF